LLQAKVKCASSYLIGSFSKIVIKNQAIYHIFYCHPPGFYAIKGNLQPQVRLIVDDKSHSRQPEAKNNLKGGNGRRGTHFSENQARRSKLVSQPQTRRKGEKL
jgi:hypothetical protein